MDSINVSAQPNGNWQVGNEVLTPGEFQSKIDSMAASGDKGLFKIGDAFTVSASELSAKVKTGEFSLVGGVNLPAPQGGAAAGFDNNKLKNLSELMGDVFKLITQTSLVNRESAREARNAAQTAEQVDLSAQVDKQKEAAQKSFQAAVIGAAVSMGVAIGSGAFSVASAAKSLSKLKGIMTDLKASADMTRAAEAGVKMGGHRAAKAAESAGGKWKSAVPSDAPPITDQTFQVRMQKIASNAQYREGFKDAITGAVTGASDLAKAFAEHDAETTRAEATQAEASSRLDATAAQEETEFLNTFQDLLRDFLQKMAAINESTEQSLSQIMRA